MLTEDLCNTYITGNFADDLFLVCLADIIVGYIPVLVTLNRLMRLKLVRSK